jgi:3-hydroxyanthranilate 3,4-dioxygenase
MPILPPINFKEWIEDNRELLKPPVGNKCVYEDAEFIVMVVGGPNSRKDYHYDLGEEFFYQIEGDMLLKIKDGDEFKDISIKEGEIFLLPPKTPHSPQRFENTVGLVIERTRKEDELDGFQWYCEQCGNLLYEEFLWVNDIVGQLPPIFDRFWDSMDNRTCKKCGEVQNPPD